VLDDQHDLDEGVVVGLAVLAVDQGDQLVGAADQQRLVGLEGPPAAVEAQLGPAPLASLALATAAATCSGPSSGKLPTTSPVAGLVETKPRARVGRS
jgi:hypothetical protein